MDCAWVQCAFYCQLLAFLSKSPGGAKADRRNRCSHVPVNCRTRLLRWLFQAKWRSNACATQPHA
ncbi:prolyl oligopeptidase family protein [Xanthomonas oryzae pv. oryzae KACC 10331]|uniref:Prolyl oligopeptidase family protein n=1 Tax=Xanthomonas oryzae pv. oryzae (strain KACC10331 / KXO85) TaxID=291331 RepID=Q5GX79_XANOR|nr:prolyl oligopeptidase family protein [Xanthomonas oryzae pv. oryzae KACC 10331]